ncbi:hypothetical protein ACFL0B_07500 [Thermodesulfobacteriota bacterium]
MNNKEENLKRAFDYLRKFYNEMAQLISDVINSMSNEGWEVVGDSGVVADGSNSLNSPDRWAANMAYKTFINSKIEDFTKGIYISFDDTVVDLPPSIILGKINVPVQEHEKWDMYLLVRKNKEKIKNLPSEAFEASFIKGGNEITGQLFVIPLSEITSKKDLDQKVIARFIDL